MVRVEERSVRPAHPVLGTGHAAFAQTITPLPDRLLYSIDLEEARPPAQTLLSLGCLLLE
jgi:hypothetical protein